MNSNIVECAESHFDSAIIAELAIQTGETVAYIRNAMCSILPVLVARLVEKATTTSGVNDLRSILDDPGLGFNLEEICIGHDRYSEWTVTGSRIVRVLFAAHTSTVRDALSSQIGIDKQSSSAILNVVSIILMNVLRNQFGKGSLAVDKLAWVLSGQRAKVYEAIPKGPLTDLNLTAPDASPLLRLDIRSHIPGSTNGRERQIRQPKLFPWLLALLIPIMVVWAENLLELVKVIQILVAK